MDAQRNENPVALAIAQAMVEGFNKHYRIFRETSRRAKESFEAADWQGQLQAVRERVQFYDDRVNETVQRLHEEFDAASISATIFGVDKILEPALPIRFAVISSVTSQVRLYSCNFSAIFDSSIL